MTEPNQGSDTGGIRALLGRAMAGGVRVEQLGPVLTVWLAQPKVRNAQSFATWQSLASIAAEVTADTQLILIRGEGPDFSAGLDRRLGASPMLAGNDVEVAAQIAEFQQAFSCWRDLGQLVVAVVQGNAIGAGFQLALAADLRIATSDARFTMAEAKLGLVPDLGGTARLLELVGYSRALELCATSRPLGALEAHSWGLVNAVVETEQLEDQLQQVIDQVRAVSAPVTAAVKTLLAQGSGRSYLDQLLAERTAQVAQLRAKQETSTASDTD